MKEVDVNDYYLISKDDFQKINNFVKDGFFMATVINNLVEPSILYNQAFGDGQQYEYESNAILNPGTALEKSELYAFYHTEKMILL